MSEILSEQQAAEALFSSIQDDTGRTTVGDPGQGAASAQTTTQDNSQGETQEQQQTSTEGTQQEVTDAFTRLDPNTIPEELKPWYHSMQSDYTRKTQAIAEQRKVYEELGQFDPNEAQAAVTFYKNLQDPQFAQSFHGQLTGTLQQMGLLEAQQQQSNQQLPQGQQQQTQFANPNEDPEGYFAAKAADLDAKIAQINDTIAQQQEAVQEQRAFDALLGEVQRQEALIKEANPHYNDTDVEAITSMAPWFNGDMLAAQASYEQAFQDRFNRMLANKTQVATTFSGQPSGTAGHSVQAPNFGDDLNAAHAAAQDALKQILGNDAQ